MIWNDPWCIAASEPGGTDLPPMAVNLPTHQRFEVVSAPFAEWIELVGTQLSPTELSARIAVLYNNDCLVATCVLRYQTVNCMWLLETFKVAAEYRGRAHFGALLLRCAMCWLFARTSRRCMLGYIWELTLGELIGAWTKGWLRTMVDLEYGWSISQSDIDPDERATMTVCDSGLGDGVGYVLDFGEQTRVCNQNHNQNQQWKMFWTRAKIRPSKKWIWTGEFIVVGVLNWKGQGQGQGQEQISRWNTPEIAFTLS